MLVPNLIQREVAGFSVVSLFDFRISLVRKLLHNLKYDGVRELTGELGEVLAEFRFDGLAVGAVLIPVPLIRSRLKTRGYNQAEELTRMLGATLGLPVWPDALKREGRSKTLVGQGAGERAGAKKGFAWAGKTIPEGYVRGGLGLW